MSGTLAMIVRPEVTKRANTFSQDFQRLLVMGSRAISSVAPPLQTLSELDDRALRDIGIERSQIEAAVYGFITLPDQGRM